MPKIQYIAKQFSLGTANIIEQANMIIQEYLADDLRLTLRQLYYQFVARDLIPNKQSEYKRLGSIISDARLAGMIDWLAIEDRTRNMQSNSHWKDPGEIVGAAARSFMLDHWEGQPYRIEVWIEKEALIGVIANICQKLDVNFFACKGYVSQSEMWSAAMRLRKFIQDSNQKIVVLHLGDHDPSGIDMTRDISDRLQLFADYYIDVKRIALNMDQVRQYNPPPNPAKVTDSRSTGYIRKFGSNSWELDALEPRMLQGLIRENVEKYRDNEIYQSVLDQEQEYLETLSNIENNWADL